MPGSVANLTKFPNLYTIVDCADESRDISYHLVLSDDKLSAEVLIFAWASLLQAYTGEEKPVFFVNNQAVSVDTSTREVNDVTVSKYHEAVTKIQFVNTESRHCGLTETPSSPSDHCSSPSESGATWSNVEADGDVSDSTTSSSPHSTKFALVLRYDLDTGFSRLASQRLVPSTHLEEIGRQLRFITQRLSPQNDSSAQNDDTSVQFSIANPYPSYIEGPRLLHELSFHHQKSKDVALEFQNPDHTRTRLTYDSLRRRSLHLAARLRRSYRSVNLPDEEIGVVPVLVPQCPELYVALLAVLELGAAFCPLNLDTPVDRIRFILDDVGAKVVATTAADCSKLDGISNIKHCVIDEDDPDLSEVLSSSSFICRQTSPKDLAYILYTSGSTGQPKGVALSHLAVTQSLLAHDAVIPQYSRFLQFASPTFDVSMFEIFFTFFRGSTLVGCSRKDMVNDLTGTINRLEIDAAELTPTVAASLIRERRDVPKLKLLLTIGEMLTSDVVREFGSSSTQSPMLYGMYGPTEAAIHCTLEREFASNAKNGLIGFPLSTVSAFVANASTSKSGSMAVEILPVGQIGELIIGGHQLADGYLNREEQTRSAFLQHEIYGRLYRTGDKARMLPDGTLECLGRIQSGQVKLRGQRMELGEVEQAAMHTKGCRLATASIIRDNLVLFCLVDNEDVQHEHVIETCRKWLLPYMMPNDAVLLKKFPQLPSGKVDKKALEASYDQEDTATVFQSSAVADPELVARVCQVAQIVLGLNVHASTDLIRAGLDSLRSINMVTQLRQQGIETNVLNILQAGNVMSLCLGLNKPRKPLDTSGFGDMAEELRQSTLTQPELKERASQITEVLPCTPLQASMLVETLKDPQAYCNWIELEFKNGLTCDVIQDAFSQLFEATPILRSGFIAVDGASIGFAQIYWNRRDENQIEYLESGFEKNFYFKKPIDFLRASKVVIFKESASVHAAVQLHHALYDGWSMDLIIQDLNNLLKGEQLHERPPFQRLTEYLVSMSDSTATDEARDYWEEQLSQRSPDPFPEFLAEEILGATSTICTVSHDITLSRHALASRDHFHPQVYFQAALSYLWASYLGSTEVMLGCVSSGRTLPINDIEDIVGPFISTFPMRVDLSRSQSIEDLLAAVHEKNREMLEHGILPLHELRRYANVEPGKPLFDVVFIWQESLTSRNESSTHVRQIDSADVLESRLLIEVEPFESSLAMRASQKGNGLPESQLRMLLQQIEDVVLSIAETDAAALSSRPIPEIDMLISEKNASSKICDTRDCHKDRFGCNNILFTTPEVFTCVIAENAEDTFQSIRPIGAVGILSFLKNQVGFASDEDGTELSTFDHPVHGTMYLTNSICRMDDKGSIINLGNSTDFDWLYMHRINVEKISAAIRSHMSVENCITMVNIHSDQQILTSFWEPDISLKLRLMKPTPESPSGIGLPLQEALVAAIRDIFGSIRETLPAHAIPAFIIPVSTLPRNFSNKSELIDYFVSLSLNNCLEHFGPLQQDESHSMGKDRLSFEREITNALSKSVKFSRSDFTRTTSFFRLGLDSISAISFARFLNKQVPGLEVDVSSILRYPTIGRLAAYLSTQPQKSNEEPDKRDFHFLSHEVFESLKNMYERRKKAVEKIRPCTPLQEGMLATSNNNAYSNHTLFVLYQDPSRFKDAVDMMIKRHDILKTCFSSTDDPNSPFAQIVLKDFSTPWEIVRVDPEHLETTLKAVVAQGLPVLDSMLPPFLITQINTSTTSHLLLSMHHALYDGEAMAQLLLEIEMVLNGQELITPPSLDTFLHRSRSQNVAESDKFWDEYLKGLEPRLLKRNNKDDGLEIPDDPRARTITTSQRLNIGLEDIEKTAQDFSVTLQTMLQVAWAKLLSIVLGTADVCFGTVTNGRTLPVDGLDRLVAPCFNTIPVRVLFESALSNEKLLKHLQNTNADALKYQFTPLRRIQSRLNLQGNRLFDTLFLLQRPQRELDSSLWSIISDDGDMGFPIVCEILPHPQSDQLRLTLHIERTLVQPSDIQVLFDTFNHALRTIVAGPEACSKDFDSHPLRALFSEMRQYQISDSAVNIHNVTTYPDLENNQVVLRVRQIISQFSGLPVDRISPTKTIYQLGLDSINAIQVAKTLRKSGYQASAEQVMEGQTAAGISLLIEQNIDRKQDPGEDFGFADFDKKNRAELCSKYPIEESHISIIRPCTQSQAGMLSQSLNSGSKIYINHFLYRLSPGTKLGRFRKAWSTATERHEMLRTGFGICSDSKYPFVMITYASRALELPWTQQDLSVEESSPRTVERLHELRSDVAKQICNHLEVPAWRILVAEDVMGNTFIQFSAHHALYDAESFRMILGDVISAYEDRPVRSEMSINPLLTTILADENDDIQIHREFWQSKLQNAPTNKFPDLNPLRTQERNVQSVSTTGPELSGLVKQCRNFGVTLQAVLQVAWARLLSEYLGEEEVTFGVVLAGRDSDGADEIPFPSTTTVPYRAVVGSNVSSMLQDAMSYNNSVRRHQHSPLTQILRWAGCSNSSLFDTLLVFQVEYNDSAVAPLWRALDEEATVEYPLSLEVLTNDEGRLSFRAVFWDDVIPIEHANILLSQYVATVIDTVGNQSEGLFELLSEQQLSKLAPKDPELPSEIKTLHGFVEAAAKEHANKLALEFWPNLDNEFLTSRWTYKELDAEGNKLANLILDLGATPGSLVAVCFDKCPEASFAMLAILKAGCGFIALDHSAPPARKAFILEDSQASLVLTTTDLTESMSFAEKIKLVCVDSLNRQHLNPTKPRSSEQVRASDISYCLYTSGSTGTPKGCILSHENAVQAMLSFQRLFHGRWDEASRWLQFASFHFDVSVLEQFWSWSVGICVVSTPRDCLFADLPGALDRLNITHIDLTPSLARLVTPDQIPSLCKGVFITGGEPLKQEVLDAWGSTGVIHNGYGPTECTIGCTMYPRVPQNGKPSNIGWQFDNVGTYVLAPGTTRVVPRGAIGELCVSGKLVGLGYLNRPEVSEESFPYIKKFDERIYRTKDLVRMLHDGSFEFLGRCDDQVKLRGQRLELGEINSAIKSNVQDVHDVVTIIVKRSGNQSEQLVSFVAFRENFSQSIKERSQDITEEIKANCQTRLPGYMVPSHVILLESIPLTPNNKSDIKRLKAIFEESLRSEPVSEDISDKDVNEEYQLVSQVLSKFLSLPIDSISQTSNLFELGLDSISIFGFCQSLKAEGFGDVPPTVIMQNHTISGLAKVLGQSQQPDTDVRQSKQDIIACQRRHRAPVARSLGLLVEDVESVFPCTALQEGMIAKSLKSKEKPYFNTFVYELSVTEDDLSRAAEDLVKTIPLLRTIFTPMEHGFVQAVLRQGALAKPLYRSIGAICKPLEEEVKCARYEWFKDNEKFFQTPIQLLTFQGKDQSYMVLNIFHALYDATGLALLLEALAAKVQNRPGVKFGPYFHEALPYGPLKKVKEASSFWTVHLEEAVYTRLSTVPSASNYEPRTVTSQLSNIDHFEGCRKQFGVTHQAIVQAAWISALYSYLKAPTAIGMVVSGRSIPFPGAENIIGPMFNTIPFFTGILDRETWKSLAQKCHSLNVSMFPFQHTPLRDIQKWTGASGRTDLFDTLFVFQKRSLEIHMEASGLWKELSTNSQPDYPLAFEAEHTSDGRLNVTIVAQGHISDDNICHELLRNFERNIHLLLSAPEQLISKTIDVGQLTSGRTTQVDGPQEPEHTESDTVPFQWTPEARMLQLKIAELAGVDIASVNERVSIFELGLDSIDAIKLSSMLKKKEFNLQVSSILRSPSIMRMTSYVSTTATSASTKERSLTDLQQSLDEYVLQSGLDTTNFAQILPATPLQEAIVADMISSSFENYFNSDILELATNIDVDKLVKSVTTVCNNSPILRTGFLQIDSPEVGCSFAQVVQNKAPACEIIQLSSSMTVEHISTRTKEQMITAMTNPATAVNVPMKFTCVVDGEKKYLVLSISHALYDGWSLALQHEDIAKAYSDQLEPRPQIQGVLEQILAGDSDEAKNFWYDTVSGTTGCQFPIRNISELEPRQVHRKERSSSLPLSRIQTFCRDHNVGLQALGQLCWTFVLATYACNLDVVFGVVLSGRDSEEAQQVMFPTMNTVVSRSVISGTRKDMLKAMQKNIADLMQYQNFPLRKVQAAAKLPAHELFNTLFIYQKLPEVTAKTDALYKSIAGSSGVGYPVCVEMEIVDASLIWRTACDEIALSEDGAQSLLGFLDHTLENLIQHPGHLCLDFRGDQVSICGLPSFKLSDSTGAAFEEEQQYEAREAHSDIDAAVRNVLAAVSKVPEKDIRGKDTVFHLGLDSISLIKVSALLKKSGYRITVSGIMKAGTVEKIATAVEDARFGQDQSADNAVNPNEVIDIAMKSLDLNLQQVAHDFNVEPESIQDILPASAAQVYFLAQWQNSKGVLFSPVFKYRASGPVDILQIQNAWAKVVKRNAILRTTFSATANRKVPVVQVVLHEHESSFVDLSSQEQEVGASWDFSTPPVRLYANKSDSGTIELNLCIHHALYDAVSLPLLIQQLQSICSEEENPAMLPPKNPFKKFLALSALSDSASRQKFWTEYLDAAKNLYPLDAMPSSKSLLDATKRTEYYRPYSLNISKSFDDGLRANGVNIQSVFLAACASVWEKFLRSSRGQVSAEPGKEGPHDVILGVYLANRSHDLGGTSKDEEDSLATLAAPTLSLVPLLIRSPSRSSLLESAQQIQADLQQISSLENSGVGLWEIEEWTGIKIDCFVNFLKLPEDDAHAQVPALSSESNKSIEPSVSITPAPEQDGMLGDAAHEMPRSPNVFKLPRSLERNTANEAFLPSWDIEAAVRNGGLDIGIFGPSEVVDYQSAEDLVHRLTARLERGLSR